MALLEPAVVETGRAANAVFRTAMLGTHQIVSAEVDLGPDAEFSISWPAAIDDIRRVLDEAFRAISDYRQDNLRAGISNAIEAEWMLVDGDRVYHAFMPVPAPDPLFHAIAQSYSRAHDYASHILLRCIHDPLGLHLGAPLSASLTNVAVEFLFPQRNPSTATVCVSARILLHQTLSRLMTRTHEHRDIAMNGEYAARILADDTSIFADPLKLLVPIPVLP